ncbi:penicillin-binding protein 2, partial [gut metagenome]
MSILPLTLHFRNRWKELLENGMNDMIATRAQKREEEKARGEFNPELKDEITGAAAVVVNVKTGAPLAIASWPTYDVSHIMENYQELMEAPNTPLFNRALMGAYAPGSTFKPCVAIASLSEGIINTEEKIKCEGVYTKYAAEGYAPECWIWNAKKGEHLTHPEENVTTALRDSCNYYFYTVSHDLGVDKMGEYAHNFGLGVKTGIELTETKGNMSNQENHI